MLTSERGRRPIADWDERDRAKCQPGRKGEAQMSTHKKGRWPNADHMVEAEGQMLTREKGRGRVKCC